MGIIIVFTNLISIISTVMFLYACYFTLFLKFPRSFEGQRSNLPAVGSATVTTVSVSTAGCVATETPLISALSLAISLRTESVRVEIPGA